MKTTLMITFHVKPEKLSSFREIMSSVKADLPKVDGCQGALIYQNQEQLEIFTLVEQWESKEKHQAHIQKVVASGGWDQIKAHLAKDPVSGYFQIFEMEIN